MKVVCEENEYKIYIYNEETWIDFEEKEELETYFRSLFLKLKKYYNIELYGYYAIHVYYNPYYGAILTLQKEEYEYYDCFDEKLDMRITVTKNSDFLYQLEEIEPHLIEKANIYQYQDRFYVKPDHKLSSSEMGKLMEYSTLIYGDKAKEILSFGKPVPVRI